jgi:hypothetical protein
MTTPLLRVLYQNLGLSGTWTASSQVSSLPASFLANAKRTWFWRSTGCTAEWIKVDLGSAQGVKAVALISPNLTAGATITIEGNPTDAWPGAFSQALVPWDPGDSGVLLVFFSALQTYRWWRISFADASNPSGYLQLGVAALGPVLDFGQAPGLPTWRPVDPSLVGWSPGGTPTAFDLPIYMELDIPTQLIAQSFVFPTLMTALRTAGRRRDVVVSVFGAAPSESAIAIDNNRYCRLTDLPELAAQHGGYEDGTLSFRESK